MKFIYRMLLVFLGAICLSCGAYFNQPFDVQQARIGETTQVTKSLRSLPLPEEPIVVGVYNFRDLTGQYKPTELGSTFSTAVTQGGTSILIKALEESKWFTPIERENIGNLLNERNIIRSTRQEYNAAATHEPAVPPLLYAGIILEGGIVSYDSNIITGGLGARYFGVGGSTQYRQDRVTIYLRAVSTSNGKILKNVYVSKTILSQAIDGNLFKYVNFQRLLEVETGITRNEPIQMAVKEAIEKAVEGLVLEGIQDGLWSTKEAGMAAAMLHEYQQEKEEAALTKLYERKLVQRGNAGALGLNFGGTLLQGDYSGNELGFFGKIDFTQPLTPHFGLNLAGSFFELKNSGTFSENFVSLDVNGHLNLLPQDKLSPYLYGGPGYIFSLASNAPQGTSTSFPKLQYGVGIEYMLTDKLSLKAFGEHNLSFSDELDFISQGKRDDFYFHFGVGINFYFGGRN